MRNLVIVTAFAVASFLGPAVQAAGTGGCESFDFPLATELEWMQRPDSESVKSGATLPHAPAKAMTVALAAPGDVQFAVAPDGKAKGGDGTFAGVVTIDSAGPAGLYQVSLSAKSWIDVVQNGKAVKAVAHTSKSDCEGLRKSVRFDLSAGPVTLQITGVKETSIKVTVRKAD